jgi:hypothetical protein
MKVLNLLAFFLVCCLFTTAHARLPFSGSFMWANGWVHDGVTNHFYILDDGKLSIHDQLSGSNSHEYCVELSSQEVEEVTEKQECRPAKEFPKGNWGNIEGGFQLSLRFEKTAFTNNEPITASLLLRNISDGSLMYDALPIGYSDGPIGFKIVSSDGHNLPQHSHELGTTSGGTVATLFPGTQARFAERLDKRFDLTNGTYSVCAVTKAGALLAGISISNGMPVFHPVDPADVKFVKSAEVTIKIEN